MAEPRHWGRAARAADRLGERSAGVVGALRDPYSPVRAFAAVVTILGWAALGLVWLLGG